MTLDCIARPPALPRASLLAIALLVVACLVLRASFAHADPVRVEAKREGDVGRVVLAWPAPVAFTADTAENRLTLRFTRPIEANFETLRSMRRYIGMPARSEDGRTLSFPLQPGIIALAYADADAVVLDFARSEPEPANAAAPAETAESAPPPAAVAPAPTAAQPADPPDPGNVVPTVAVRSGQHPGYSRLVFDWDARVGYAVERGDATATIVFDRPANIDPRQFRRKYLKYVQGGTAERQDEATRVVLQIAPGAQVRDSVEGRRVVIDVLAPVRDAGAAQGAMPGPAPTPAPPPVAAAPPPPVAAAPPPPPVAAAPPQAPPPPPPVAPPQAAATPPAEPSKAVSLRFPWDRPVAAAVFRRGDSLWCIFDAVASPDLDALRRQAGGSVTAATQRPHPRATVLRLGVSAALQPHLQRDGLDWIVRLQAGPPPPGAPILPVAEPDAADGPRLLLPVSEPGLPLAIDDPEAGDTLVVVPLIPLQSRIAHTVTYPQFRLPATAQGIVVEPWIESLRVRSLRDGVELSSSERLALSASLPGEPGAARGAAAAAMPEQVAAAGPPRRLLDPRAWEHGTLAGIAARRQALERTVVQAPDPAARERNRLRLAQFLLGQRFAAEALGVLAVAAAERPELAAEPAFLLLRGAANLLAGRDGPAHDDLARSAAGGSDEALLWAAAARPAQGLPPGIPPAAPPEALPDVLKDGDRWSALLASYPPPLRVPLGLRLAGAATAAGAFPEAQALIEALAAEPKSAAERAQVAYLDGLRKQATGDSDGALAAFGEAARLDPRRGRVQAELARVRLLVGDGRMPPGDAAAALEPLRAAWRGDTLEFAVLQAQGTLQLQAGEPAAGLRTLRLAAGDFPELAEKAAVTQAMAGAFEDLYLHGAADRLSPVAALGLYEEFKELTPPGEKGDAMIRRLAERLVQVDLLDRAAELLERQAATAPASPQKAQLGARLAEIRLLDDKPQAALDALARTRAATLPQPLQQQRALLQARAQAALGRGDEALASLGRDDSLDAQLLRARVYRQRGDWEQAAVALRQVVDAARADGAEPLTEQQARDVLDLAVALTLAGGDAQLSGLDDRYRTAMAATPMRDAFRLLAGSVPPPDADAAALGDLVERAMAFRRSLPGAQAPAADPGAAGAPSR